MKASVFVRYVFKHFFMLFITNTFLQVLGSLIEVCSFFAIGPLVDLLIHPNLQNVSSLTQRVIDIISFFGLPPTIYVYLIFFIFFTFFSSSFRIVIKYFILKSRYVFCRYLMVGVFEDCFNSRWYFFSSSKQGVLLNTFIREYENSVQAFTAITLFFANIVRLIFCLAVPFYISWQVTSISLFTSFLLASSFVFLGRVSYRLGQLNTSTANQMSTVIQESFTLAKDILGFGNQQKSIDNLNHAFEEHRKVTVRAQTISGSISILYRPFGIAVLGVALVAAQHFKVPLSELAVLLLALLQVVITIGDLISDKNTLNIYLPSYEQINNLKARAKQYKQGSGNKVFTGFERKIMIENLTFAYPNHAPVLQDINIEIPKGKLIAIVGESGSGKSTLIDMIMGFNEPNKGRITFDGIDLREFNINSYRKRIGYVSQDAELFNMSIRDNLLWANEKASENEIKHACQQANAEEFIKNLPKEYDTLVGDRGVRLSGGQRQRIALARAILRKPELLFLDEATSALDTHSERLIQKAIENIAKETTVVAIAHRLSTIINADYIYVLRDGKIIEEGVYSELVQLNGDFSRMIRLQALETQVK